MHLRNMKSVSINAFFWKSPNQVNLIADYPLHYFANLLIVPFKIVMEKLLSDANTRYMSNEQVWYIFVTRKTFGVFDTPKKQ